MQNRSVGAQFAVPPATTASLSVHTTVSRRAVRPGGTITFTIKVSNGGETVVSEVTICDQLPTSVAKVVHAGGLHLFDGNACRTVRSLPARTAAIVRLVVMIARHARAGLAHNMVLVFWPGSSTSASATYRIITAARRCPIG
jgi:uncharacterized repeat protein (TIGR01451 family)